VPLIVVVGTWSASTNTILNSNAVYPADTRVIEVGVICLWFHPVKTDVMAANVKRNTDPGYMHMRVEGDCGG
jgi:hypothetical protein